MSAGAQFTATPNRASPLPTRASRRVCRSASSPPKKRSFSSTKVLNSPPQGMPHASSRISVMAAHHMGEWRMTFAPATDKNAAAAPVMAGRSSAGRHFAKRSGVMGKIASLEKRS